MFSIMDVDLFNDDTFTSVLFEAVDEIKFLTMR